VIKCITTPIFYASGEPHVGHAYSAFIADAISRFHQLQGCQTFLVTGTDENGQKIERSAYSSGSGAGTSTDSEIKKFVDKNAMSFRELWKGLDINFDQFVRTTGKDHHVLVESIWNKLISNDDIYLGTYEGLYCTDCEQFYSEWQLSSGSCPIHNNAVERISEPSYLFRLNKYREKLLDYYRLNPEKITPTFYQQELIHYLDQSEIEDLSISRVNVNWGIQVPNDTKHTVYVWLDALFSYVTAIQNAGLSPQALKDTTHVIGKDILQFHGIYWPAFLFAADLPFPEKIVVHGWWTLDGYKISKSNPASLVKPLQLSNAITNDGLRYGLLRQKPLSRDGNFKMSEFVLAINSDLSNNLGNLVKRFSSLVNKFFRGEIILEKDTSADSDGQKLIDETDGAIAVITEAYLNYNFQLVCTVANHLVSSTNRYIHNREPWKLDKGRTEKNVAETLCVVNAVLKVVFVLYNPIIPEVCRKIQSQLTCDDTEIRWPQECVLSNVTVKPASSVFARLSVDTVSVDKLSEDRLSSNDLLNDKLAKDRTDKSLLTR
jgi:methionyl-tRNA synthetase